MDTTLDSVVIDMRWSGFALDFLPVFSSSIIPMVHPFSNPGNDMPLRKKDISRLLGIHASWEVSRWCLACGATSPSPCDLQRPYSAMSAVQLGLSGLRPASSRVASPGYVRIPWSLRTFPAWNVRSIGCSQCRFRGQNRWHRFTTGFEALVIDWLQEASVSSDGGKLECSRRDHAAAV